MEKPGIDAAGWISPLTRRYAPFTPPGGFLSLATAIDENTS